MYKCDHFGISGRLFEINSALSLIHQHFVADAVKYHTFITLNIQDEST